MPDDINILLKACAKVMCNDEDLFIKFLKEYCGEQDRRCAENGTEQKQS